MHIYEFYNGRDRKTWEPCMKPTRLQTSIGTIMNTFNQKLQRQRKGSAGIDSQDVIPLILHFLGQAPFNSDGTRVFNKKVWSVFVHATMHKRQDEQSEAVWNGLRFFKMGFHLGLWVDPAKVNFVQDLEMENAVENQPWRPAEENQQKLEETDEIAFIPLYNDTTPIFFDQRLDLEKLWTIPDDQMALYLSLLRRSVSQTSGAEAVLAMEDLDKITPLVQRRLVEIYQSNPISNDLVKIKYDCLLTGPNSSPLVPIPPFQLEITQTKPIVMNPDKAEEAAPAPSVVVF